VRPAAWPRERPQEERLLHVDPRAGSLADHRIADLPGLLRAGDLLVVNDAATLPASLSGKTPRGEAIEVRLASHGERTWTAVLFGAGDWTFRTEDRPPPPIVPAGAVLAFDGLSAVVRSVDPESPRLVDLEFDRDGDALWSALYRRGRPVQYSYLRAPLPLWHTQTAYASRPWAMETPSAGRPLTWEVLAALRARGVEVARVTHAAGLSSTGDPALDARLPLPERFEVPEETVAAVAAVRERKGRVVAVGTTVVRALEGASLAGDLRPGAGLTHLRIGPGFRPRVCDGVLTGMHEPDSSHFALLMAFASPELLAQAHRQAEDQGYLAHEFGDSTLVLPVYGR
jgi:S-adenosylmethionine:tRNA ribosyltransferase-isomerase